MSMWAKKYRDTWLNVIDEPSEFSYISKCIVDFETGLVFKDGKILWQCANENIIWHKRWVSTDSRWADRLTRLDVLKERMTEIQDNFYRKLSETKEFIEIKSGTTLHLLHPFNRYVFGHMYDTLQKLEIVEKNKLAFNSVLLPGTNGIIDFDIHLKAFGLDKKELIRSNHGLVKVNYLIFIQPVGHPTSFTPESYEYVRSKYQNYYGISSDTNPSKKIFLTRRRENFRRYLLNDDEIYKNLSKEGILYFDGSEKFDEIYHAFSNASHIAGVHGSLFTNNIFGNASTHYREYCPEGREVHTFHHQYKLCKEYEHILVKGDEENNIAIDLQDLMNFYNS